MTLLPPGVKVHLTFRFIGMRKGINGLAMLVEGVRRQFGRTYCHARGGILSGAPWLVKWILFLSRENSGFGTLDEAAPCR